MKKVHPIGWAFFLFIDLFMESYRRFLCIVADGSPVPVISTERSERRNPYPLSSVGDDYAPTQEGTIVLCAKRRRLPAVEEAGPASGGPISFGEKKWGKETPGGKIPISSPRTP